MMPIAWQKRRKRSDSDRFDQFVFTATSLVRVAAFVSGRFDCSCWAACTRKLQTLAPPQTGAVHRKPSPLLALDMVRYRRFVVCRACKRAEPYTERFFSISFLRPCKTTKLQTKHRKGLRGLGPTGLHAAKSGCKRSKPQTSTRRGSAPFSARRFGPLGVEPSTSTARQDPALSRVRHLSFSPPTGTRQCARTTTERRATGNRDGCGCSPCPQPAVATQQLRPTRTP
jgi:hypothetical protein